MIRHKIAPSLYWKLRFFQTDVDLLRMQQEKRQLVEQDLEIRATVDSIMSQRIQQASVKSNGVISEIQERYPKIDFNKTFTWDDEKTSLVEG